MNTQSDFLPVGMDTVLNDLYSLIQQHPRFNHIIHILQNNEDNYKELIYEIIEWEFLRNLHVEYFECENYAIDFDELHLTYEGRLKRELFERLWNECRNEIITGSSVVALIHGRYRGATVLELYESGAVRVECYCPNRIETTIKQGSYQLFYRWHNPIEKVI